MKYRRKRKSLVSVVEDLFQNKATSSLKVREWSKYKMARSVVQDEFSVAMDEGRERTIGYD